jgi:hypothetical protein
METMERGARDYNKDVSSESDYASGTSAGKNRQVQQTIGFISLLVIKLVTDKTFLRHDY